MKNWIIIALVAAAVFGGALNVLAAAQEGSANVEIRVWQRISDGSLYLSTRPEEGEWVTHNTALDMSEVSPSGLFRQSSFVTVAVPLPVSAPAGTAPAGEAEVSPGTGPFEGDGETGNGITYFARENSLGEFTTYINAYSPNDAQGNGRLAVYCQLVGTNHVLGVVLANTKYTFSDLPPSYFATSLSYNFDGGRATVEEWERDAIPGRLWSPDPRRFVEQLLGTSTFSARTEWGHWTFDVSGMMATPAQWNIERCLE